MKQLSSWSSPIDPRAPGHACRQPHIALFILSALCHIMTACSSPSSIPAQFDAIERMSIQTVLVHDQRIAYLDVGAGPPVILIHGFGGSMWQWEQQQRTLSQHFRVLTLDLPGAGLSDKPEIGSNFKIGRGSGAIIGSRSAGQFQNLNARSQNMQGESRTSSHSTSAGSLREFSFDGLHDLVRTGIDSRAEAGHDLAVLRDEELLEIPFHRPGVFREGFLRGAWPIFAAQAR